MSCDEPAKQCLAWHIQPKLAGAKTENDGLRIRARCPVCETPRSLTISAGQQLHTTWNCFNDCAQTDVRAALLRAGIDAGCLPVSKSTEKALGQTIAAVMQQVTQADRAQTFLRAYLIALGYRRWPKGGELVKLASEVQVSKTVAYDARGAGPLLPSPGTPSTNRSE